MLFENMQVGTYYSVEVTDRSRTGLEPGAVGSLVKEDDGEYTAYFNGDPYIFGRTRDMWFMRIID